MPLYEYECANGHRFEKIQKFSDPLVAVCPTCGAAVQKLMSSPAIQFKGSGFYITDYAKKDSTAGGQNEKSEKGEKAEKSEKSEKSEKADKSDKTDSKAETKTDATASQPASPAPKTSNTP
jgi:putative FmdB family regulatory protein